MSNKEKQLDQRHVHSVRIGLLARLPRSKRNDDNNQLHHADRDPQPMFLQVLHERHFLRRWRRHRRGFGRIGTQRQHSLAHKEDIAVLLSVESEVLIAESDVVIPLQMLSHRLRVVDRGNGLVERDALLLGQGDADLNSGKLDDKRRTKNTYPIGLFRNTMNRNRCFFHIIRFTNSVGETMGIVLDEARARARHVENKINIGKARSRHQIEAVGGHRIVPLSYIL